MDYIATAAEAALYSVNRPHPAPSDSHQYPAGKTLDVLVDLSLFWHPQNFVPQGGNLFLSTRNQMHTRTVQTDGVQTDNDYVTEAVVDALQSWYSFNSPPDPVFLEEWGILDVDDADDADADLHHGPLGGPLSAWRGSRAFTSLSVGAILQYAQNPDIPHLHAGSCVIDALLWEADQSWRARTLWTRPYLQAQLGDRPSLAKLLAFLKTTCVGLVAIDCTGRILQRWHPETPLFTMYCMVRDSHCYPLTNPRWRAAMAHLHRDEIVLDDLDPVSTRTGSANVYPQGLTLEQARALTAEDEAVVCSADVTALFQEWVQETRVLPAAAWTVGGAVQAFRIPQGPLILAAPDYTERAAIAAHLQVDFSNQSWGVLARQWADGLQGMPPPSQYNRDYVTAYLTYPMGPYRACFVPPDERATKQQAPNVSALDIVRCYSSLLLTPPPWMPAWPQFGFFDAVEPCHITQAADIGIGEYRVDTEWWLNPWQRERAGWYPDGLVRYSVQTGVLQPSHITHVLRASSIVPSTWFQGLATAVRDHCPGMESKALLNSFVGLLGRHRDRKVRVGVMGSMESAYQTVLDIRRTGGTAHAIPCGSLESPLWTVLRETTVEQTSGYLPIYRALLAAAHVALSQVVATYCRVPGVHILGFNTDAVWIEGTSAPLPAAADPPVWGTVRREEVRALQGHHPADFPARPSFISHQERREWSRMDVAPSVSMEGLVGLAGASPCLITGESPGCGKTWLMAELWKTWAAAGPVDNVLVTAYTHAACAQLRAYGAPAVVLNKAAYTPGLGLHPDPDKLATYKRILLDEYAMMPPDCMQSLLQAVARGTQLWCAGDILQCVAPAPRPLDYRRLPLFQAALHSREVRLPYRPHAARFDPAMKSALDRFQTHGTLDAPVWQLEDAPDTVERYVCYTNATRQRINAKALHTWAETCGALLEEGQGHVPWLARSMPLMVYHGTDVQLELLKTQVWVVQDIVGHGAATEVVLEGPLDWDAGLMEPDARTLTLSLKQVGALFDYPWCVTAHKIQSGRIRQPYAILDAALMNRNTLYTALSRGTRAADIWIPGVDASHRWALFDYARAHGQVHVVGDDAAVDALVLPPPSDIISYEVPVPRAPSGRFHVTTEARHIRVRCRLACIPAADRVHSFYYTATTETAIRAKAEVLAAELNAKYF